LNRAVPHPPEDAHNSLGFLSDSKLSLIMGEAIQTIASGVRAGY